MRAGQVAAVSRTRKQAPSEDMGTRVTQNAGREPGALFNRAQQSTNRISFSRRPSPIVESNDKSRFHHKRDT